MMTWTMTIYNLMIKEHKLFLSFFHHGIIKEIHVENMFSVILLSYRNTCESLGELEKAVETLAC